uniref:Uncharacterized protein n=1 Tax=Quercus lobata TaxID=97700 RepID=A0A7N2LC48_QUELO
MPMCKCTCAFWAINKSDSRRPPPTPSPQFSPHFGERAARVAAEVRKKAAARGLLIRVTPDAAEGGETDGVKKEANGHPSNGPVDSKNNELTSGQEDQAHVGLGTGSASLDAKKQKAKAKAAA